MNRDYRVNLTGDHSNKVENEKVVIAGGGQAASSVAANSEAKALTDPSR